MHISVHAVNNSTPFHNQVMSFVFLTHLLILKVNDLFFKAVSWNRVWRELPPSLSDAPLCSVGGICFSVSSQTDSKDPLVAMSCNYSGCVCECVCEWVRERERERGKWVDGKSPCGNPLWLGLFPCFKKTIIIVRVYSFERLRRLRGLQNRSDTERKRRLNGAEDRCGEAEWSGWERTSLSIREAFVITPTYYTGKTPAFPPCASPCGHTFLSNWVRLGG